MNEAKTQSEFDELSKSGEWFYVTSKRWVARGTAHVVAWGSAHVEARDSAHVVAWGSAHVVAWGRATCSKCSPLVDARGNVLDLTIFPKTVKEWLSRFAINTEKDKVILYKGVDENYKTQTGTSMETSYKINSLVTCPDWSEDNIECGNGLHFCHHPMCCEQFQAVKHYLACSIKISDIRVYNGIPQYPDKIRAKACKVLYEVDRWGNKINQIKRDSKGRFCK